METNKFDEKYEIRFAHYEEIDEIMRFIDEHWKKGHILSYNRELFEYDMVIDGRVNFMIARNRESGMIEGLAGFIPASRDKTRYDTWGSIWKVVDGAMGLLGLELSRRIEKNENIRSALTMGINPETAVPIVKRMRHFEDVGKMQHFYCLADCSTYQIAKVQHYEPFIENIDYQVKVTEFKTFEELEDRYDVSANTDAVPYKDSWYVKHRYFDHPIYHYQVFGLSEKDVVQALLVCRTQEYAGAEALRIVDYIGEARLFAGISGFLKEKLQEYEYIELYCYGFDTSYVKQSGMTEVTDHDTNIIPNYFSPYVAENIDVWVGVPKGHAVFFKADGDQDRPN